ncbi:MAG: permease-like cell division protein FtsX [bacterium]|nr:permease-like cell division protein FtsX [bacterium]
MIYIIQEAVKGFFKNKSMSFITIGIITISIFIFGLFIAGTANMLNVIKLAEDRIEMIVYLKDNLKAEEIKLLDEQIATILGVQQTEFVSKEQALENFKKEMSENSPLLSAFESNPLPASIKVTVSMAYKTPEYLREISEKIKLFSGVEDIDYGSEWIDDLDRIIKILFFIDIILGIIITLSSVFVVFNTIRLTVYARREQIDIMDLVGATETYIELPYIIEGIVHGLFGSLISTALLYSLFSFISTKIPNVIFLNSSLTVFMVFFGMILGFTGSFMSVKQCMNEIREVKRLEPVGKRKTLPRSVK